MISQTQITEILSNFDSGLSAFQKANRSHSISWKQNCKNLFDGSNDIETFKKAVRWCGTNGNVSRTVKSGSFDAFCEWLFNCLPIIKSGSFKLKDTIIFNGKKPLSWVSKVSHIINPRKYPVIYDSYIRKTFCLVSLKSFQKVLDTIRKFVKRYNNKQIYFIDSSIWAKNSEEE